MNLKIAIYIYQNTVSTIWTTPLLASTSVAITLAFPADDSIVTPSLDFVILTISPFAARTSFVPKGISAASLIFGNTWRKRTDLNCSTFSGTLANASLWGANTVKEPSPSRVSTKPAALTAVTRVERLLVAIAALAIDGRSGTLLDLDSGESLQVLSTTHVFVPLTYDSNPPNTHLLGYTFSSTIGSD